MQKLHPNLLLNVLDTGTFGVERGSGASYLDDYYHPHCSNFLPNGCGDIVEVLSAVGERGAVVLGRNNVNRCGLPSRLKFPISIVAAGQECGDFMKGGVRIGNRYVGASTALIHSSNYLRLFLLFQEEALLGASWLQNSYHLFHL